MPAYYDKVDAAIIHLRNRLPSTFNILKLSSSDPPVGDKHPQRYDRLDVTIKTDEHIPCQIIFDSYDYSFPPDIVFPDAPGCHLDCLPEIWDIADPSCLLEWLLTVQSKLSTWNVHPLQNDVVLNDPIEGLSSDTVQVISDDDDEYNHSSRNTQPAQSVIYNEKCRDFVQAWLRETPDHVVQYDAEYFQTIALYLSVSIPQRLWATMQERAKRAKETRLDIDVEVSTARQMAPVIVYFQLQHDFPATPIKLTMVSAVNTESSAEILLHDTNSTAAPDVCEFSIEVDPSWSLEDLMTYVRNFLVKEIPKFHSQLYHS